MRACFLGILLLLLLGSVLTAGERPVVGPETVLGDTALRPIGTSFFASSAIASDEDGMLFVFSGRGALYAQRLDRDGRLATPLPTLLVPGIGAEASPYIQARVVWTGGLYWIFFWGRQSLELMRVTRDLETVDVRPLEMSFALEDLWTEGDQLVLVGGGRVWRLRQDLSVAASQELKDWDWGSTTVSRLRDGSHVYLTGLPPAITARLPDGRVLRLVSTSNRTRARMVWTGREYLAAWASCDGTCRVRMQRLDEALRPKGEPVLVADSDCYNCDVGLTVLGDETVLIVWRRNSTDGTQDWGGKRYRADVSLDPRPLVFGPNAVPFLTAQGLLLAVDTSPAVRVAPPPGTATGERIPPIAEPQAAAEEVVVAVASSPTGIAVARQHRTGEGWLNAVTILDRDGAVVRDVPIAGGPSVSLASDGRDFYALIRRDYWTSALQKVDAGSAPVNLGFVAQPAIARAGDKFVTLESGWFIDRDGEREYQYKTRLRWLDRGGRSVISLCPVWDIPTLVDTPERDRVAFVSAGGESFVMFPGGILRLRDGCAAGPPEQVVGLLSPWRFAWQDDIWAFLVPGPDGGGLDITFSRTVTASTGPRRALTGRDLWEGADLAAVAPIAGNWLVASSFRGELSMMVVDPSGYVAGSRLVVRNADRTRPLLVPLDRDRVLAIYTHQIYEPPYLGVTRVVVAPVTTEPASRRRGVRP